MFSKKKNTSLGNLYDYSENSLIFSPNPGGIHV